MRFDAGAGDRINFLQVFAVYGYSFRYGITEPDLPGREAGIFLKFFTESGFETILGGNTPEQDLCGDGSSESIVVLVPDDWSVELVQVCPGLSVAGGYV